MERDRGLRVSLVTAFILLMSTAMVFQTGTPVAAASGTPVPSVLAPDGSTVSAVYLGSAFIGGSNGSAMTVHSAVDSTGLADHTPIDVDGDAEFAALAIAEGWPGNGSSANPYLVEGYHFVLANNESAITIANVDLCFSVRDCVIEPGASSILPGLGVNITSSRLIDVTGLQAHDIKVGLLVDHVSGLIVKECSLIGNDQFQAQMTDCTRTSFLNDSFEGAACGIGMEGCDDVTVVSTSFLGMEFAGCEFQDVDNASFWSNAATGCCPVIAIGSTAQTISLPLNNTENGRPVFFLRGADLGGSVITGDYGYVWLYGCRNGTVNALDIDGGTYGVDLEKCTAITLRDSRLGSGKIAVALRDCHSCAVMNCTLASSPIVGTGIMLQGSDGCDLIGNSVQNGGWGIMLLGSENNSLRHNTIELFMAGAMLDGGSNGNSAIANMIRQNLRYGIKVEGNDNAFLSNTFVDNCEPSPVTWSPCANDTGEGNRWNTSGTPHGYGNYWSNFTSPSHDGILDYPVPIATDGAPKYDHCALAYPPGGPSQPRNLSATSQADGIKLKWSPPGNVSGSAIDSYTIYRLNGSTWRPLASVSGTDYVDTGVSAGVTYQYAVSAWNLEGEGNASAPVSAVYLASSDWGPWLVVIFVVAVVLVAALSLLWRRRR